MPAPQQTCGQNVCTDSPATEGGSSRSESHAQQQQGSGRTGAQSPRAGRQARPPPGAKAKAGGVLGTILSPVLSLLHGGGSAAKEPQEEEASPSTVLLEVRSSPLLQQTPTQGHLVMPCTMFRALQKAGHS
jgi:hypothetical protein